MTLILNKTDNVRIT